MKTLLRKDVLTILVLVGSLMLIGLTCTAQEFKLPSLNYTPSVTIINYDITYDNIPYATDINLNVIYTSNSSRNIYRFNYGLDGNYMVVPMYEQEIYNRVYEINNQPERYSIYRGTNGFISPTLSW